MSKAESEEIQRITYAISKYEKIPPNLIRVTQTHISRIFITPGFVYKQKKPVNFGFVDYSSLEKRRFFARKELSLNRRACSGIYLGLAELRQRAGHVFIGFKGGALEDVLVRMRHVASERFLNGILDLDSLDKNVVKNYRLNNKEDVLKRVARRIYLFHKNAKSSKRISGFAKTEVYRENWDDNFLSIGKLFNGFNNLKGAEGKSGIKSITGDGVNSLAGILEHMKKFYDGFLRSRLFNEFVDIRIENGFIKDLHGDLRMEHIAVIDRRRVNGVCLMDCAEFNERFRNQDLYLDVAFLLMDFEFNGFFYESVLFFNYYKGFFNYKKDIRGYEKYEPFIMPFFKAYRSVVRTKISFLSGRLQEGLRHLNLALFYVELLKKPVVILNIGLSGSGKSLLSGLLAGYFYSRNIKSDVLRHEIFGYTDKILKYSRQASETVYDNMLREGVKLFNEGKSIIFDATFLKREHREKFFSYFAKKDCNFAIIYSKIYNGKEEVILKRLKNREVTGGLAKENKDYSEAGISVYLSQKTIFEEPEPQDIPLLQNCAGALNITFITVDASLELSERFNYVMKKIKKTKPLQI
ncbi:MAG: AAA family ATPase [Deltaproteobacteria bacterium]|nr:AAA family ATPase [Deltaproteobacteria bacterium]